MRVSKPSWKTERQDAKLFTRMEVSTFEPIYFFIRVEQQLFPSEDDVSSTIYLPGYIFLESDIAAMQGTREQRPKDLI